MNTIITTILAIFTLLSPKGDIEVTVSTDEGLRYSVCAGGQQLVSPSAISMTLSDGTVLGGKGPGELRLLRKKTASVDRTNKAIAYKRAEVRERYNSLMLTFKSFCLEFRAFDDGVAYRFIHTSRQPYNVVSELAEFNFPMDPAAYIPYVSQHTETLEGQFYSSCESFYAHSPLSGWDRGRLAFLPIMVEAGDYKLAITEADLKHYPGMYLYPTEAKVASEGCTSLSGVWPAYPDRVKQGGHNMLQDVVQSRKDFLAEIPAGQWNFPWRIIGISSEDRRFADSDLVYNLAEPLADDPSLPDNAADGASTMTPWEWVKPGKVAWDWWNNWNIYGVDFQSGVNDDTYKYYIDFASGKGIEYVILDEGWSVNLKADLMQVVPEIHLPALCEYAASKGVGLILWAGYKAFDRDMENVCRHYSEMGIKGFKIDFMDRDDAQMMDFYYRAAATAAKYRLLVDFHGACKPTGLCRTYPNVVNYEGVHGLENMKWENGTDQVSYDVTIPYIRMFAGPMDYTQGAMRNASREAFRAVNDEPMSQGTRCRQLAEYIIFDAPLTMMCDSPSNYVREKECSEFIAAIPTVWDETAVIDGKVAEYIVTARRKGDVWYLGAIGNWDPRSLEIPLDFLPDGRYTLQIFRDGENAHRAARDFALSSEEYDSAQSVKMNLAPGGGWVARITALQ